MPCARGPACPHDGEISWSDSKVRCSTSLHVCDENMSWFELNILIFERCKLSLDHNRGSWLLALIHVAKTYSN